jgi:hypothetical protein
MQNEIMVICILHGLSDSVNLFIKQLHVPVSCNDQKKMKVLLFPCSPQQGIAAERSVLRNDETNLFPQHTALRTQHSIFQ